jgi:hypothetical protein
VRDERERGAAIERELSGKYARWTALEQKSQPVR